ncbi:MAG: rhodanese-like domain-containing protein [Bacteriovoracaceae bacterium]|nr:rhodanese-like domain-containing protein [Bacteriovoracaceae bacterium]
MLDSNILESLNMIQGRLSNIEKKLVEIEEKVELSVAIQRNHLLRIKHGEPISDQMILTGTPYNDLSPEKAWELYQNQELDFFLIDVAHAQFQAPVNLPEAIKIPLEDLPQRFNEISNHTTPVLLISEDGVRSIQACELLAKKGYYNVNNISGGYLHWPDTGKKKNKNITT